ncbi:MAG: hypothetical protein AAGA45_08020, partial [Verrucomicrobiota bacterium]
MRILLTYLAFLSSLSLIAQAPPGGSSTATPGNSSAESQTPPNANTMNVGGGSGMFESDTLRSFSKDIFDTENDAVDFEEGTLNWKGRTFSLGNSRVMRARFERYLASPLLTDEDDAYLSMLSRIHDLLSLVGETQVKDDDQLNLEIYEAWQLLFQAARYEMDGGTSLVIANQVYNVWRIRDENLDLDSAQVLMEQEKRRIQSELVSGDWYAEGEFNDIQKLKAEGRHTGELYEGITEATFRAERLAETQARIGAIDAQRILNGTQAKLQFQSQLLNMLLSRRYEHCL